MTPPRSGVSQQAQLPRIALVYPDWAKRARYQADWPAVCCSSGRNSFADSGMDEMPLELRSLSMDCPTATGSSPFPSRWSLISLGSVPSALTVASHVCHSLEFCPGVAASDGPTMSALGSMLRISRTAEFHISKYWVVSMPGAQKIGSSGLFQMSLMTVSPAALIASTTDSTMLTQFEQLPSVQGYVVPDGCDPSAP